jgi:hypothetical protein
MHPGSITSKDKVERHSMTDGGLLGIYKDTKDLAVAPGDSGLDRKFNAKDIGTERTAVDAIDGSPAGTSTRDWAQKGFKIKAGIMQTKFTGNLTGNAGGLGYAKVGLGHDNTKYAPGGRL